MIRRVVTLLLCAICLLVCAASALAAANDCMKKGLAILADPTKVFPGEIQMVDRDTLNQIRDLYNNFFSDKSVTPEAAQAQFVEIIKNAPPL